MGDIKNVRDLSRNVSADVKRATSCIEKYSSQKAAHFVYASDEENHEFSCGGNAQMLAYGLMCIMVKMMQFAPGIDAEVFVSSFAANVLGMYNEQMKEEKKEKGSPLLN